MDTDPLALKRKLDDTTDKLVNIQKKLKVSHQRNRRLKRTVHSLKAVVEDLKDNGMVSDNCAYMLDSAFSSVTKGIINRIIKNKASGKHSRAEYDPVIKAFALTLQFYSAKA